MSVKLDLTNNIRADSLRLTVRFLGICMNMMKLLLEGEDECFHKVN